MVDDDEKNAGALNFFPPFFLAIINWKNTPLYNLLLKVIPSVKEVHSTHTIFVPFGNSIFFFLMKDVAVSRYTSFLTLRPNYPPVCKNTDIFHSKIRFVVLTNPQKLRVELGQTQFLGNLRYGSTVYHFIHGGKCFFRHMMFFLYSRVCGEGFVCLKLVFLQFLLFFTDGSVESIISDYLGPLLASTLVPDFVSSTFQRFWSLACRFKHQKAMNQWVKIILFFWIQFTEYIAYNNIWGNWMKGLASNRAWKYSLTLD